MRSGNWMCGNSRDSYIHRAWMRRGNPDSAFDGSKPQIAIVNTYSDLTPCNAHLNEIAQSVKNGIWEAGGIPHNLPMLSLGETNVKPTSMLWRNMAAMATEEMIRANPIDGVVLLGGCDKTIPALLMGAASVNLPAIVISGGPMLNGTFRGKVLGCGTDVWRLSEEVRAGTMTQDNFNSTESAMIRSKGHCNTMGTASTMGAMAEALGMTLPGISGTPAPDNRLLQMSHESGRRIVEMIYEDLKPSDIMVRGAFLNAIVTLAGIGGSSNAVVHLLAIAGRLGVDLSLKDFDEYGSHIPLLVNLQPAGEFLMEDLFRAGGLCAVMKELQEYLDPEVINVTGKPLVSSLINSLIYDESVITPISHPLQSDAGIVVLYGNLAPNSALIKPAAASPHLLQHSGKAVVFHNVEDFHARIDDPDLDVDENSVLVLRGCGPKGYPGMPEVSNMPLPAKLLSRGVTDMVRICDGRMSGTAYGTVILHVSPEAAAGGPLGLVQDGDIITLDCAGRKITLEVSDAELATRKMPAETSNGFAKPKRGWERLYIDHVQQAEFGADLDFLNGSSVGYIPRESH